MDEALAGFADYICLTLQESGHIEVSDNGRGMPVDIHKDENVSGVELILTRLHAGGKFSKGNYKYSCGLHGVGVSVVNALSKSLEVVVKRDGKVFSMEFANGEKLSDLKQIDTVGKRNTGTTVRFIANEKYFDSIKISISKLKHVLRAKAVLCSGLKVEFVDKSSGANPSTGEVWFYQDGLVDYLTQSTADWQVLPV